MADRVELLVQAIGLKETIKSMGDLEKAILKARGMKVELQVDRARITRDLDAIRDVIDKLTRGDKEVHVNIEGVDRVVSSLEEAQKIQSNLIEMQKLYRTETGLFNAAIAQGVQAKREMTAEEKANAEAARQTAQEYENMANSISAMGHALQALGSASMFVHDFASEIGEQFSAMSKMFSMNVFDTAGRELTRLATQSLVGDISKITSRYDIMSTFTKYMELAGVASDEAADALQRVNDSILGLPIGLDESAQRLRRYQMFLGDVNQATNLTIGLQKALYAGGANEQMRNMAFYQIDRLLSAGELNTARQWMSLINGLGVSVRFLAEELGTDAGTLATSLSNGTISTQEFLDSLMALGEGSSAAAQKLDEALEIYKGTLESWISNIRFAAVRGGETILKSLNAALNNVSSKGIVDYMEQLRGAMNDMYSGIGAFIVGNPALLTRNMDALERLFAAIDRFSASRIAEGILDNLARGVDMLSAALNKLPVDLTEQFIVFATTLAGPLGKLFQTIAAGAPIVLGIFNRFKDFDFEHLLDRIIREVERLANVITGLLNIIPDGLLAEIMAFGLVWGKPVAEVLNDIGSALLAVGGAVTAIGMAGGIDAILASFSTGLASIGAAASVAAPWILAVTAAVGGLVAAIATFRSPKALGEEVHEALGLDTIDAQMSAAERVIERTGSVMKAQEESYALLEKKLETGKRLAQEIITLGAQANTNTEIDALASKVSELQALFPGISIELDKVTGRLTTSGRAAAEAAAEFMEYQSAIEKVDTATEAIEELTAEKLKLEIEFEIGEQNLEELREKLRSLQENPVEYNPGYYADNRGYFEYKESVEQLNAAIEAAEGKQQELSGAIDQVQGKMDLYTGVVNESTAAINGFEAAQAGATDALNGTEGALERIRESYAELREEAAKSIGSQIEGFEALERAAATSAGKLAENQHANAEYFAEYNRNLETILSFIDEEGANLGANTARMLAEAVSNGIEGAANVAAIAESIRTDKDSFNELTKAYEEEFEAAMKAVDLTASIQALTEQFTAAYDEVLANAEGSIFGEDGIKLLTEKDYESIRAEAEKLVVELSTALNEIFAGVEGEGAEIKLFSEDTVSSLITPMWEALMNEESGLVAGFNALQDQMTIVTEETIPAMIEALENLQKAVEDLKKAIDDLTEAMKKAEEITNKLREAIIRLADAMNKAVPSVDGIRSAIDTFEASVQAAISAVSALISVIGTLNSMSVNIPSEIGGSIGFNSGGGGDGGPPVDGMGFSKGGPVYLARGGSFWKPCGTDTVPAMLTPGEFVMRKSAVQKYGLTFMERINSLDIGAAIDAMYRRIPQMPMHIPYYHTVNNRTYDNHATVNQNIYTNNPDYAYRRANRWAQALT